MRILDNVPAMRVFTNMSRVDRDISRNTMRLSSGFRINNAGDDPAGLAIGLGLRGQVRSKDMANRNTLDGASLLETADATLQDVQNMLQRIRELAVQAANDTNVDEDRMSIQMEIDNLLEEIDAITNRVEFNNIRLLNGEARDLRIQVGGRKGMSVRLDIPSFRTDDLGLTTRPVWTFNGNPTFNQVWSFTGPVYDSAGTEIFEAGIHFTQNSEPTGWYDAGGDPIELTAAPYTEWHVNVLTGDASTDAGFPANFGDESGRSFNIQATIDVIDEVNLAVSLNRSNIGAFVNRFEYTSSSLQSASEATSRSLSRIMDTDMAREMMHLSSNQILSQAGMSIMAQANQRPQQILQLLQ